MRKLMAALAILVVAACTDQPTQPAAQGPQLASMGAEHGAWVWSEGPDYGCGFWDAAGNPAGPVPCGGVFTPGGNFGWRLWSTGRVANTTGRAYHSGPTSYPQYLEDAYVSFYGFGASNGVMPLCDWDVRAYPDLPWDKLVCTTNWHFTISAAGKAMLVAEFDRAHSWYPYPNGRP